MHGDGVTTSPDSAGNSAMSSWQIIHIGSDSFEIQTSLANGSAPVIADLGQASLRIGEDFPGWDIDLLGADSFRILQSISNPPAPTVLETGAGGIQLGAS